MLSRRALLKSTPLLALAPSIPQFLTDTACVTKPLRDDRVLVVLQLTGGNDGINTVVPYRDEGYQRNRKHLRLPDDKILKVNNQVGLHPKLKGFAKLLEDEYLSIVHGVGYPNPSRSHFESMSYWHTAGFVEKKDGARSEADRVTGHGWLGSALENRESSEDDSPASVFVGLGTPAPALRGRHSPAVAINRVGDHILSEGIDPQPINRMVQGKTELNSFIRRSMQTAYSSADQLKEAVSKKATSGRYPRTELGDKLRLVSSLIQGGFETRVFYTEHDGYDTHSAQLSIHASLLGELSEALKAFQDDLASADLADRVTVMVFSEFGRRVAENGSFGTDHGTAAPVFLVGGAVRSGFIGSQPSLLDLVDGDLKMEIDFRRIYATLLEDWLSIPATYALSGDFQKLQLLS